MQENQVPDPGKADLKSQSPADVGDVQSPPQMAAPESAGRLRNFGLATLGLALCFSAPLWDLVRFSAGSELFSYILLIPFISLYLAWPNRQKILSSSPPARGVAALFLAGGAFVL